MTEAFSTLVLRHRSYVVGYDDVERICAARRRSSEAGVHYTHLDATFTVQPIGLDDEPSGPRLSVSNRGIVHLRAHAQRAVSGTYMSAAPATPDALLMLCARDPDAPIATAVNTVILAHRSYQVNDQQAGIIVRAVDRESAEVAFEPLDAADRPSGRLACVPVSHVYELVYGLPLAQTLREPQQRNLMWSPRQIGWGL